MVSVVVVTFNRAASLLRTVAALRQIPDAPAIVVVDNGSQDATVSRLRAAHPDVRVIALARNAGAWARNAGVEAAQTAYVAFCDDDCWWAPGALMRAASILDAHAHVGAISARVLIDDDERLDPACVAMGAAPASDDAGIPIDGFMAGASVFRRSAFLDAGGYHARFHIGAEEALLAVDLRCAGWTIVYRDDVVLHHHPYREGRDHGERRRLMLRNRLWTAWLRHSFGGALRATVRMAIRASRDPVARAALRDALGGLRWVLHERRPVRPTLAPLVERLTS